MFEDRYDEEHKENFSAATGILNALIFSAAIVIVLMGLARWFA